MKGKNIWVIAILVISAVLFSTGIVKKIRHRHEQQSNIKELR